MPASDISRSGENSKIKCAGAGIEVGVGWKKDNCFRFFFARLHSDTGVAFGATVHWKATKITRTLSAKISSVIFG